MEFISVKTKINSDDADPFMNVKAITSLLKPVLVKGNRVMFRNYKDFKVTNSSGVSSSYYITFIVSKDTLEEYTINAYKDLGYKVGTIDLNREQRRQMYTRIRLQHIEDGKTDDPQYWFKKTGHYRSSTGEQYGRVEGYSRR